MLSFQPLYITDEVCYHSNLYTLPMMCVINPTFTLYRCMLSFQSLHLSVCSYNTRGASLKSTGSLPSSSCKKPRVPEGGEDLLGACVAQHVPHGEWVSVLRVGDVVQAMLGDNVWDLCRVVGIRRDGELLRNIKVCPIEKEVEEDPSRNVWLSVEDGRIAPPQEKIALPLSDDSMKYIEEEKCISRRDDEENDAFLKLNGLIECLHQGGHLNKEVSIVTTDFAAFTR